MSDRKSAKAWVAPCLCLLTMPLLASSSTARASAVEPKADIALEIQNLMGRRMFYHSVGHNEDELALWSKKQTVHWGQNQGCWVGMASLKVYYGDMNRKAQDADLKRLSEINPLIKNIPENRGIGSSVLHILTNPIIEVAEDRQSAKGLWYTPGVILSTRDGKSGQAVWMWERYGGDFIREDGKWVILNLQVNTDFGNPMGQPLEPQRVSVAQIGKEGRAEPTPAGPSGLMLPGPDIPQTLYQEYTPTRVPTLTPRLPEAYSTLDKTFKYADCSRK
jgi:hypothetical protein